jgi:hypothetical protein
MPESTTPRSRVSGSGVKVASTSSVTTAVGPAGWRGDFAAVRKEAHP